MRSASLPPDTTSGQPLTTTWWLGDQTVTWDVHDGLASVVIALTSASVSGLYPQHSDIGGYTAVQIGPGGSVLNVTRSCELLMRWAEFAAFTSLFRTHLGQWYRDRRRRGDAHSSLLSRFPRCCQVRCRPPVAK